MELGLVILLGGFLLVCLYWGIPKFLKEVRLLRNGVITDGHIWAHRQVVIRDDYEHSADHFRYFLMYSYDCNGSNYLNEEKVDEGRYNFLKDGDNVKVRCLPEDPMTARLEE